MADFKYEITKPLGVVGKARGWDVELNLVSWNEAPSKYDIRSWSSDHTRMGKGISLTEDEMKTLVDLFNSRDEDDSFE